MSSVATITKQCVPSELNPPLNVKLVTNIDQLSEVQEFIRTNTAFGLDLETNVTETFYHRRIRTIQLGNRDVQFVIDLLQFALEAPGGLMTVQGHHKYSDCLKPIVDTIRPCLESNAWIKIGHGLDFEYTMMRWCFGIRAYNFYDTLLAEKVLYAGAVDFFAKNFWGLDDVVERRLKLTISKEYQTSFDLVTPLSDGQITYAGLDARLPLGVKASQYFDLTKANLLKAANIEFNTIPVTGDLHLNGVLLDKEAWRGLYQKRIETRKEVVAKLDELFLPIVGQKVSPEDDLVTLENNWKAEKDKTERAKKRELYKTASKAATQWKKNAPKYEGQAAINYAANAQLKQALRYMGYNDKQLPDTSEETFKKLKSDKVIELLLEYRKLTKAITTYGEEFIQQYVNPDTGRIHQRFNQLGAATGRASSSDPNMQNLVAAQEYRSCFVAKPGHKLITIDFNSQELRVMAEYSQEPAWIDGFKKKWDIHSLGAEMLFGQKWRDAALPDCAYYAKHEKCDCPNHKGMRKRVKACNFLLAYGGGPRKLGGELDITEKEAKDLLDQFNATFKTLVQYLDNSGKRAASKLEARSLSQRRRLFEKPTWDKAKKIAREDAGQDPTAKQITKAYKGMFSSIERRGKNHPIQSSSADMVKTAVGCGADVNGKPFLWHQLPKYESSIENIVHDEVVICVPDEHADEMLTVAIDSMQRAGAEFVRTLAMTAEGFISNVWQKD